MRWLDWILYLIHYNGRYHGVYKDVSGIAFVRYRLWKFELLTYEFARLY